MATTSASESIKKEKPDSLRWYAVYTNPRAEKMVADRLEEAGVEYFLPMMKTYRKWSDRKKLVVKPLLSSYVFVRVLKKNFPKVYTLSGVVKFISFESKPVPIPQVQIDNLRLIVDSNADIEVTSDNFEKGDNIEVMAGALAGLKGELIRIGRKKRVVVRIEKLEQNILVTIPTSFLKKL